MLMIYFVCAVLLENADDGICEWKAGSSYAAIPECFSDD